MPRSSSAKGLLVIQYFESYHLVVGTLLHWPENQVQHPRIQSANSILKHYGCFTIKYSTAATVGALDRMITENLVIVRLNIDTALNRLQSHLQSTANAVGQLQTFECVVSSHH